MNDRRSSNRLYALLRSDALRFGFWGGVIGVLVDLDHIPWAINPQVWTEGRILHPALLVIAGVVAIGCVAYLTGLYIKLVLRKKRQRPDWMEYLTH